MISLADFNVDPANTPAVNRVNLNNAFASGEWLYGPRFGDNSIRLDEPIYLPALARYTGSTVFKPDHDFGAGHALFEGGAGIWHDAPILDGLRLSSGFEGSLGTSPCAMAGIWLTPDMKLVNADVWGFHAGYVFKGDHQQLDFCRGHYSYYNVLFDQAMPRGNQQVHGGSFALALRASIGIEGQASMDCARFTDAHLGFSPIGIERFGANPSVTGINASLIDNCNFEAIGNNAILDSTTGGTPMTMRGAQIKRINFTNGAEFKLPGLNRDYTVDIRQVMDSEIDGRELGAFRNSDAGAYRIRDAMDEVGLLLLLDNEPAPKVSGSPGMRWERVGGSAGAYARAKASVAQRDALEFTFGLPLEVKPFGTTSGHDFAGIALQSGSVDSIIAVQDRGRTPVKATGTNVPTGGLALKPSGTRMALCNITDAQRVGVSARNIAPNSDGEMMLG